MNGIEAPLFRFTCEFAVRYERNGADSMQWRDFSSAIVLAHIVPYLREFVSNMTNRLPAPVLMLDPINTHLMVEVFERMKASAASKEESSPKPV